MSVAANAPPTPFKGLAPFQDTELDALLFSGRDREREVVVANLLASRLTVLYGASGVGKTSLLRAAVAHSLRRAHDATVVLFSSWAGDPRAGFGEAVDAAAGIESRGTVTERLAAASRAAGGDVYAILDQFEEYFLYHERDPFADELAEAIREPLRTNFLLGLREDALAKLDAFKGRIPNLFANYLRLDHLDRRGARAAILGPIERYNELTGEDVRVEPELVESVLDQVAAGKVDLGRAGRGGVETGEERIEAPYLQLVLERLWEVERESGSTVLRLATLRELGGAESIVRAHLERALGGLQPDEQDVAATIFDHLVTPSGSKIAHRPGDLAQYAAVPEADVRPVLNILGRERIVRAVDGSGGGERYEIFHDVLADGVLAWRGRYEAERELGRTKREADRRQRRLLVVAAAALVALLAMAALAVFALTQRSSARSQARHARAGELAARALSQLSVDPQRSLRLAVDAAGLEHSPDVENALRQALLAARLRRVLPARGPVTDAVFSPDGSRIVTASEDGKLRIYDRKGRPLQVVTTKGPVADASFSPHGRLVVAASADGAQVWDVRTGELRSTLSHGAAVNSASFSRDGRLVVTASADRTARVWEARTGRALRVLRHEQPVLAAAFSPDARLVATVSGGSARIFSARTGRLMHTLRQPGTIQIAAFSPDGKILATGGSAHTVRLWDPRSGRLQRVLNERASVTDVVFSPGGKLLVTTSSNGGARVWQVPAGTQLAFLTGHTSGINRASFSPHGRWIITASQDKTAGIYEAETGSLKVSLRGHRASVTTASYSPTGNLVVTASKDGSARVWDPGTEHELLLLGRHAGPVRSASFSPDGRRAVSASDDDTARVWRVRGRRQLRVLHHHGPVTSASFSPHGRLVLTTSLDGTARIWRGGSYRNLRQGAPVTGGAFSPDGKLVATGGTDGSVRIWHVPGGSPARALRNGSPVTVVGFSPNGKLLVTAGSDGTARLWDAASGSLARVLRRHHEAVTAASFSLDSRFVVTASRDGKAIIWDAGSGRRLHVLHHHGPVTSASFSPDGRLVVTSSRDTDGRIWSVATGKLLHLLRGQFGPVQDAEFSPDGRWVVTAGPISAVLWPTATGRLLPGLASYLLRQGGHGRVLTSAKFGPGGRRILTASSDGTVKLYECRICPGIPGLVRLGEARLRQAAGG